MTGTPAGPQNLPDHIRSQWPFTPRFARVNGCRMHYVDEGAGDPVVLLHGNPTWGFLYREFIGPLVAAGHRVIVPDMIGFGLSEKPRGARAATGPAPGDDGLPRLGRAYGARRGAVQS